MTKLEKATTLLRELVQTFDGYVIDGEAPLSWEEAKNWLNEPHAHDFLQCRACSTAPCVHHRKCDCGEYEKVD